jgi:hypothetical protein
MRSKESMDLAYWISTCGRRGGGFLSSYLVLSYLINSKRAPCHSKYLKNSSKSQLDKQG